MTVTLPKVWADLLASDLDETTSDAEDHPDYDCEAGRLPAAHPVPHRDDGREVRFNLPNGNSAVFTLLSGDSFYFLSLDSEASLIDETVGPKPLTNGLKTGDTFTIEGFEVIVNLA